MMNENMVNALMNEEQEGAALANLAADEKLERLEVQINTLTAQANQMALTYICAIGRCLVEAKQYVGHGGWGAWLKDRVHYSQSTAENYISIYNEYGSGQISMLFDPTAPVFERLGYTKLLALTAVDPEKREEFAEAVDAENISVRELKERIAELTAAKDADDKTIEQLKLEKEELAALLVEAEGENNEKIAEEVKGYRDAFDQKLAASEQAKEKAQKQVEKLKKDMENVDARIAQKAKELADEEVARVRKEKEALYDKLGKLEKRAENAGKEVLLKVNYCFEDAQDSITKLKRALAELPEGEYDSLRDKVLTTLYEMLEV